MTETTHAAQLPNSRAEFNDFLYADIGAEMNGTMLSVLSAMARMNLDPWREAAILAEMPSRAAVSRLAALIAALPGRSSTPDEQKTMAERLMKLLPQHGLLRAPLLQKNSTSTPPSLLGVTRMLSSKAAIYVVIALIALTFGVRWFVMDKPPTSSVRTTVSETAARPDVPLSR